MVKYLLDTCVVISLLRGQDNIQEKIMKAGVHNCGICELTLAELYQGPYKVLFKNCPPKDSLPYKVALAQINSLKELSKMITVLPMGSFAETFAVERMKLFAEGNAIDDIDLLIGTFALSHKFTLVTGNEKHFNRINGLSIDNWYV